MSRNVNDLDLQTALTVAVEPKRLSPGVTNRTPAARALIELLAGKWPACVAVYERRCRSLKAGAREDAITALAGAARLLAAAVDLDDQDACAQVMSGMPLAFVGRCIEVARTLTNKAAASARRAEAPERARERAGRERRRRPRRAEDSMSGVTGVQTGAARHEQEICTAKSTPARSNILTAVRVGEAREMRWSEVDLATRLWTCPWQRTKTGKQTRKDHLVPLSNPALAIIKKMQDLQRADGMQSDFVFVHLQAREQRGLKRRLRRRSWMARAATGPYAERVGKLTTHAGVIRLLQRSMARKDLTVHGFRTTFSSWANDMGFDREAIEMALDHLVGNRVERIYSRDAQRLKQRQKLMEAWGKYLARR